MSPEDTITLAGIISMKYFAAFNKLHRTILYILTD